jgi:hypothetical protein
MQFVRPIRRRLKRWLQARRRDPWKMVLVGRRAAAKRVGKAADRPSINAGFPGGNILVDRIVGNHIYLRPELRDTRGTSFYWYFRVRRGTGRKVILHFTTNQVVGGRGPALSTDAGATWKWLPASRRSAYAPPDGVDEVRFCVAVPYLETNLRQFLARHAEDAHLRVETLATTRGGRDVERLRLGKRDGQPEHRVLLTCRHHACEMMASWVLEGLLEAVLADTADGAWFRDHVELLAVPFMDKDGVEDGDPGKNRRPHDHNRDYLGESIYPSVGALRRYVPDWSGHRLRIALDLHCPDLLGGGDRPGSNERIYFCGGPSPGGAEQLEAFSGILQQVRTGTLPFDSEHNLRWGQGWNTDKEPRSCSRWAESLPGVKLSAVLEIPYAVVGAEPVTAQTAGALGHDLALAVRKYLEAL